MISQIKTVFSRSYYQNKNPKPYVRKVEKVYKPKVEKKIKREETEFDKDEFLNFKDGKIERKNK